MLTALVNNNDFANTSADVIQSINQTFQFWSRACKFLDCMSPAGCYFDRRYSDK